MRARNIKPGFFENEEIADMPYEARLLFIGLWCLADREGRLEFRLKRIKALLFAYDQINIPKMLDVITCHGFIVIYGDSDKQYIQIVNFKKHQRPHPHEAKSVIAPCNDITRHVSLIPDVRNVDVRNVDTRITAATTSGPAAPKFDFEILWKRFPKRLGKKTASRHFSSSVKTDVDFQNIQKALSNYLRSIAGKEAQYVQHGSTWFNNWQDWIEYREEKYASNGGASKSDNSAFIQRVREAQGLRKADFEGSAGSILSGIRDSQMHEE